MTDKQEAIILNRLETIGGRGYVAPKGIAKWVREDIAVAYGAGELGNDLPEGIKFSVTSRNASAVEVTIKDVPPEWLWTFGQVEIYRTDMWHHSEAASLLSKEVEAIRDRYNKTYQNAWDRGADYTQRRYYGSVSYDYRISEPKQTEN